jgi:hypothetical protein
VEVEIRESKKTIGWFFMRKRFVNPCQDSRCLPGSDCVRRKDHVPSGSLTGASKNLGS